jgi:hypothetical protein
VADRNPVTGRFLTRPANSGRKKGVKAVLVREAAEAQAAQVWLCLSRNQRLPRRGDCASAPGGSCWRGGGHSKH